MVAGCPGAESNGMLPAENFRAWSTNISTEDGFNPRAVRQLSELAELDFECKLGGIFACEITLRSFFLWGFPMLDPATTALLRAVLDEVCESVSRTETGARTHVASKILEAASRGETSTDHLKQVGRQALSQAPTMWR